jgi:glyceraldehyde 3-phosphate dehydrogenase
MVKGVGISGMGRIGRLLVRMIFSHHPSIINLKAINCIYPAETIAHLLRYDSVHGKWEAKISVQNDKLIINGHQIDVTYHRNPEQISWTDLGVEIVLDATGKFNDRDGAERHLAAGAKKVIITAPGKQMDLTVVMGVNEEKYQPERHHFLSAASCTTNCVAPVLHILDRAFGVQNGWVSAVHSFTSDQNLLDNPHKDLRRARACTQSIVPTTTGVGKALADVLPHLAPQIQGISLRVPTQDVSLIDLTVRVSRSVSAEEVKSAFILASKGDLAPYIDYNDEPLVSADYIGCPKSAVVDGLSIMVMDDQIKVLAWYDNEWAYACRVVELTNMVAERTVTTWEPTLAL